MARWRLCSSFAVLLVAASSANAQPVDPYARAPAPAPVPVPAPAPVPPVQTQDPILAEQVASSLVERAQELLEARIFVDAKQLAVEALVKSPNGPASQHAKAIIKQANAALGIVETPVVDPVKITDDKPDTSTEPVSGQVDGPPSSDTAHPIGTTGFVHGALYGGVVGAMFGAAVSDSSPSATVPFGIGLGVVGALGGDYLARHYHADAAQVRTVGAGTVWGGIVGGLFGGTIQGANGGQVTGAGVLVGAAIGSTIGGLGTIGLARDHKFTRGDVALIDTFGGMGTVGGLTIGMLMQPAQREAYSLNSALGAAAGVIVGVVAAPQTNTTEGRMVRVAGLSLAGGGLPFLLYAGIHDKHSTGDERLTGGLASLGLIGGAWLGFYLTRHFEEGQDVLDGGARRREPEDAPAAVVGRSSAGRWALNGVGISPLSAQLAPQPGMAFTLVGGAF